MSREESAIIYLDNQLGFHGGYIGLLEAEQILSEKEKQSITKAVSEKQRIV
jgi:hypothetical protein